MSFVSYAQNFEDVMLWRALKHIESGFYIDIGANDPTLDSVTKAFYDRGWNGINVEPIYSHFNDLNRERTRDINLRCAAGDSIGEIEIWECDVRGWATASKNVIKQHQDEGYQGIIHKVPLLTLISICEHHVQSEIHFLKIDVEGFEKYVISGMDFSNFRPWILIIESTKPNSVDEFYKEWEDMVLSAGYVTAYADGLNRFYVSNEHKELLPSLKYPPNVFDDFIHSEQLFSELRAQEAEARATRAEAKTQEAETRATRAEAKMQEAETRATRAEAKTQEAETRATRAEAKTQEAKIRLVQMEATIDAIYNSRLWQITAPWRWAGNFARWFVHESISWLTFSPGCRPRRILRSALIYIKLKISAHPLLKVMIDRLLFPFPQLRSRLCLIGNSQFTENSQDPSTLEESIEGSVILTPRARKIYLDLITDIERCRKEQ